MMFKLLLLTICLQWCLITSQTDDSSKPPCDNSNIDVQKCNAFEENYRSNYFRGPDFHKIMEAFQQLTAPPYKNCSIDVPPVINGQISVKRTRDYCQWYTSGQKQKNVFVSYEADYLTYLCDYDATNLNIGESLQSILNLVINNPLQISFTSCSVLDSLKNIQLDMPENLLLCLQAVLQQGWMEKGSFGGSFKKLPVNVQFHIIDKKLTIDKLYIDSNNFAATSTKTCSGDPGFKAICKCFQSSKMYDSAAQALVNMLLTCAKGHPEIVQYLENSFCSDE